MNLFYRHRLTAAFALIMIMLFARGILADGRSKDETNTAEVQTTMKIRVTANGKAIEYELNNSPAAQDLYDQLPLNIDVENYSDNEKIFYPPRKLNTTATPLADARAGTLAYYAPWGNVVMFYGKFGSATGLYELGHAVSGGKHINKMTGSIHIEKIPNR